MVYLGCSGGKRSKGGGGGGGGSGGGGGGGGGGGPGGGGVGGGGGGRGGGGGGGGGGSSGGGGSRGGGAGHGAATQHGGLGPCTYVLRTGTRSGEVCGLPHTTLRCFGRLTDAWRTQFPDAVDLPRWHDLLLQNVPIFDLDIDAILATMYALADITEGDSYLRVPPDPGTVAASLGASAAVALGASASAAPGAGKSPLSGTAPTESLHTFTLDSGASRSFFRDTTMLTPPRRPVAVSLADPSGDSRVTHCTCSRTGRHLATFTRRPGSSLYTLTTAPPTVSAPPPVAASSQVFAAASRSSPASAPCSCRPLAHETLLWHHRLRHPSLPRLRGMASRALVSGLPRSLPALPPRPAPTCVPCVEGRQRAAPHSSSFPLTEAPLQTLHMDGIRQTFTLPASPQQNGIAERRIGMVMDVAGTSMIHAAAPHFLWPFAVQYTAHQINLQPRVSLPETTPTMRWMGKVGDASAFRVWGSRAFVCDTTADKLSSRAVPCVFLGCPPDAPGWQFYHPTLRRVLSSQDVTIDESGPAPSVVSQVDPAEPVEVAVDSGAESGGAAPAGAESGGVESGRAEPGGAEPTRASSGGALGVPPRREPLSPQRLCEWYSLFCRGSGRASGGAAKGAAGARGAARASGGAAGAGVAGVAAGTGGTAGARGAAGAAGVAAGAGGAGGAAEGAAAAGAAGGAAGTGDPGAEGTGPVSVVSRGAARPRPYYVPLLQQPASPLPGPNSGPTGGLTERHEPESRPVSPASRAVSPVRSVRAGPCPSAVSSCVLSFPASPGPESDSLRAACPAVPRFLATAVIDPLFESSAASALVSELVDFAAACRLDYAASLVAKSVFVSVCPPSVGGECALGMDVFEDIQEDLECFAAASPHLVSMLLAPEGDPDALDIPTPHSYAEAIEGPYSSQWQAAMDAEMASWKSTGTSVDEVPPPGANIISGMWIFKVKRLPGSPPAFKARYVARGFSQRQGVDFFQTFSPTPKMTTLQVLLHVATQRDYELHSLDFSTAFLQGSLHEEIWLRRPPGFTGSFPAGTQWSLRRPVYGLRQAPREWHNTLRTTLASLGCAPSTADPSLFLCTDATLPPFYVLVYVHDLVFATADTEALAHVKSELQKRHTCTDLAPPLDESVEPSGPYPKLVSCLMFLMTCTRPDLAYPLSLLARYVAPSRHRKSTHSSSVLSSSCEAEIYAGAMAAQELRWLTYLLTDLGEAPHSPPVLYVDNKAMLALCQEHRLEHRTKMATLRVLLHVAAQRDYELHSLDFSTAFLQGSLHEEIWLRRPPGFSGSFPAGTQWSLWRPVYGLRQAPREWHDTLRTTLASLGFAPSTADPSLFLRTDTTLPPFYVLVYVDDLVFATGDTEELAHVKSELQKRHTCTDLGELTSYLGLRITRDRAQRTITLTRSHMVQQVLQRFGFTYSSPQSNPLPTGHSLSAPPSDESVEPSGPYPELVGCLMYLMTCTRPDLAYPLSLLARYVAPGRHRKVHWDAAKRVLQYLCSTSGMGLVLGGRARVVLTGHADASWVDDLATQRSSQGYTFSLGSVSWRSARSSSVLSSRCEAEIYAGAMAAQELRWLTYLLADLGEAPRSPPVLYVDNKAMLALC
ncbi:unnamed protein product [Closterium sp. NIES-54]